MGKIKEATDRIFGNVYVCKKCKHKQRSGNPGKIRARKIICRNCSTRNFRPKTKEKKVIK